MEEKYFNSPYKKPDQPPARPDNATGFGGSANDYAESVDLNKQLIKNKASTFFMKVRGNSMMNAGIQNGDIVLVDRSMPPLNGKIVIAIVDGEMLIRRLERTMNKMRLVPEGPKLSALELGEFNEAKIWGVVTYVIHSF